MNHLSEAKRGRGIDELIAQLVPQSVEDKPRITVVPGTASLLGQYRAMFYAGLTRDDKWLRREELKKIQEYTRDVKSVLSPAEITGFFEQTKDQAEQFHYGAFTGLFLTKLIQNSYNAGYNRFSIDTRWIPHDWEHRVMEISYLGHRLRGREGNLLRLKVTGSLWKQNAAYAQYLHMNVTRGADKFGPRAKNCELTASKANTLGSGARYCQFKAVSASDVGKGAKHSSFYLSDRAGGVYAGEGCTVYVGKGGADCAFVKGAQVTIEGKVRDVGGVNGSKVTVHNDVDTCGIRSKDSEFEIFRSARRVCVYSKRSKYKIHKDVEDRCGRTSDDCEIEIGGSMGPEWGYKGKGVTWKVHGTIARAARVVGEDLTLVVYDKTQLEAALSRAGYKVMLGDKVIRE